LTKALAPGSYSLSKPIQAIEMAKLIKLIQTKYAGIIFRAVPGQVFNQNQWVNSAFSLEFNQLATFT
jgi:hypothetical protein